MSNLNADFLDSCHPAFVVFCGKAELAWLRLLKPGFRHCFVVIEIDDQWVIYNPLSNGTQIDIWNIPQSDGDEALLTFLTGAGNKVIETTIHPLQETPLPWRPFTCVEAVLRALHLRKPWCFTPWQLFKALGGDEK